MTGKAWRPLSMNEMVLLDVVLEMGNIQLSYRVQRQLQGVACTWPLVVGAQLPCQLSQRTQHTRAIEPLALTVLTEAHEPHDTHRRARRRDG